MTSFLHNVWQMAGWVDEFGEALRTVCFRALIGEKQT